VVEEGVEAPDFELTSDAGERVRLSQFRGRPVVLYFYPRDDSRVNNCSNELVKPLKSRGHGPKVRGSLYPALDLT
jgi:peroxiredoxin